MGESPAELYARVERIDEIHRLLNTDEASAGLVEELVSRVGDPAADTEKMQDVEDSSPDSFRPRWQRSQPSVRFIYFLQKLVEPADIKIGVADDLVRRFGEHRKRFGELAELGVMRWRNDCADDNGHFEGKGVLPEFSPGRGRGGTALIAEKLIHNLFHRERRDKRRNQPFGSRHEWFRASRRLRGFIAQHAVKVSDVGSARLHELDWSPANVTYSNEAGSRTIAYIDFRLPSYLVGEGE